NFRLYVVSGGDGARDIGQMLGRAVRQEGDANDLRGARSVERFRLFGESEIVQRKRCVFHGVMPCGARSDNSYVMGATERIGSLVAERRRAAQEPSHPFLPVGRRVGRFSAVLGFSRQPKSSHCPRSRLRARDPFLAPPPWAPYRSAAYPVFAARQPMEPLIEGYRRFRYEAFPLEIQRAPWTTPLLPPN